MFRAVYRAYRLFRSDSTAETVMALALLGVVGFSLLNERR